jgi:hypothetical protein
MDFGVEGVGVDSDGICMGFGVEDAGLGVGRHIRPSRGSHGPYKAIEGLLCAL